MPRSGPTGALRSHYDRHCRSHMFYRRVARQTITTTPRETRYSILAMPHLPLLHIGTDTIVVVKARCRSAQGKAHKILSNSLRFCCICQDKLRSLGLGGSRRMVAKKMSYQTAMVALNSVYLVHFVHRYRRTRALHRAFTSY